VALDAVAASATDWLRGRVPAEWGARYGRRAEEYRFPTAAAARAALADQVGQDGLLLLGWVAESTTPAEVRSLRAVEMLRQMWIQHYVTERGHVRLRTADELPPVAQQLESPHEVEARYGEKRGHDWLGYKVHVTETCDAATPHLVVHVATTIATASDREPLATIQAELAAVDLAADEQFVDEGYMSAAALLRAQALHGIALVGPIADDRSWQARTKNGITQEQFHVDWDARTVTCPEGRPSVGWSECGQDTARASIQVRFARADCAHCPSRPRCTRATGPRTLTLPPRAEHEAVRQARERQTTESFRRAYATRAGIEGTLSQGVRPCGLRHARYRGLAKTHLQHVLTAVALNVVRLADWLDSRPRIGRRTTAFERVMVAA
jgi:transposase